MCRKIFKILDESLFIEILYNFLNLMSEMERQFIIKFINISGILLSLLFRGQRLSLFFFYFFKVKVKYSNIICQFFQDMFF